MDRYLDQLEARARQKKAVTALEIEPGVMAISDLADRIGLPAAAAKRGKFAFRMSQLALELEGRSGREDKVDLRALGEKIRTMHEPEARRALVAQYPKRSPSYRMTIARPSYRGFASCRLSRIEHCQLKEGV